MLRWLRKFWVVVNPFFLSASKTAVGVASAGMASIAEDLVFKVEKEFPDASGRDKFRIVKNAIRNRYPTAKDAAINLAIEIAVALVTDWVNKDKGV